MEEHAHIPKFGNWTSNENAAYTQYFENAEKGRKGGRLIKVSGARQSPNSLPEGMTCELEILEPRSEQHTGEKAGDDHRGFSDSSANNDSIGANPSKESISKEQHADVPTFGNWEGNDSIAYTAYFDNARDGRNRGNSNNHSKHQKDPNAFPSDVPKSHASLRNSKEPGIPKFKHEQHIGRKDASYHSLSENDDAASQKSGVQHKELLKSNNHRGTRRTDGETDHNIKLVSSSNPDYQAKSTNTSGSSPSTNRKKGSPEGDSSSSTAQRRSKSRPADKASRAVEKALPVPKFGEWDVNDPSSAERYTDVFNNVRQEKKASSSKIPIIKTDPVFDDSYRQGGRSKDSTACWCFSWYGK